MYIVLYGYRYFVSCIISNIHAASESIWTVLFRLNIIWVDDWTLIAVLNCSVKYGYMSEYEYIYIYIYIYIYTHIHIYIYSSFVQCTVRSSVHLLVSHFKLFKFSVSKFSTYRRRSAAAPVGLFTLTVTIYSYRCIFLLKQSFFHISIN